MGVFASDWGTGLCFWQHSLYSLFIFMNSKLVGIGVVVVVLLGLGWWSMQGRGTGQEASTGETQESAAPTSGPTSLKGLLGLGLAQQCTFSDTTEGAMTSGTVYVSNGKMRGDFTSTTGGQTVTSHMISDSTNSYIWMDGQSTGLKTTFEAQADGDTPTSSPAAQTGGVDVNKDVNYSCSPWLVDSSKYNLPSGVQFTDLNNLFPAAAGAGVGASTSTKTQQCAACDTAPASAKAQCLAALGCN